MKKDLIYILLISFLFSCDRRVEEQEVVYYIIKKPPVVLESTVPPPPPTAFYGSHNFIILNEGKIFYHNKFKDHGWCGTGIDYNKPDFLHLAPLDLKELTNANLEQFIDSAIQDKEGSFRRVFASISSPVDTITNKQFQVITDTFRKKGFRFYTIRTTTEEEQAVLNAKIRNESYNPYSIKWKVGFGNETFLPPKTEE